MSTMYGIILFALTMSGIYYWCQRVYWWLYKRQASLPPMMREEIGKIMSPPDVLFRGAQLQGELDAVAFIYNMRVDTMIESSIRAYGGVDEKDAGYVANMIAGTLRIKTIVIEEFDSEERQELIVVLKRILDCRPDVKDDSAELMRYWVSILEAAERLEQHRIANKKK